MKTDELVTMLATGSIAVNNNVAQRRLMLALGMGMAGSILLMAQLFGIRTDLAQASRLPMFWAKVLVPLITGLLALQLAWRLSIPATRTGAAPIMIVMVLLVVWVSGATTLLSAPMEARGKLIFGDTWKTCALNITLLSLPLLIAAFWAIKGLAPTRLVLAGGAAGLLAGAIAAGVYTLHCPEMTAPFLAIWYVLGIAIASIIGAMLGPRLLRW